MGVTKRASEASVQDCMHATPAEARQVFHVGRFRGMTCILFRLEPLCVRRACMHLVHAHAGTHVAHVVEFAMPLVDIS